MNNISAIRRWEVGSTGRMPQLRDLNERPTVGLSKKTSLKFLVLSLSVLLLLFAKIYVKAMIIGEGYRIEEVRKIALTKDTELRALRLQFASVTRPDVLTQRARALGLRPALPQQLRRLTQ